MGIKNFILTASDRIGFLDTYALIRRKLTKSQVAILMYHRVGPKNDTWSLESLDPQTFQKQIEYFSRNFELISLDELVRCIRQKKSLPKKAVAITFDDGYRDNYLHAYPIIKKYNIPTTIFLTTGHIGTNKLFWWDKVSYIVKHTRVNKLNLGKFGNYLVSSDREKSLTNNEITEKLKKVSEDQKQFLLEKLIIASNVLNIPPEVGEDLILSWDDVKEMMNGGIDFGAHSVNHPILTNMPLEQAKWEIAQSVKSIEEKLGKKVNGFSYPNGDYNSAISKFIQDRGFSWAVAVLPNKLVSFKDNPYELRRLGIFEDFTGFKLMFCGLLGDLQSIRHTRNLDENHLVQRNDFN
jgi:peptidoglycan/xylan/chitin deacetylase (PgdA/CDA1 family)